jgi:transcriptional regulator with XRE-family HTH domain
MSADQQIRIGMLWKLRRIAAGYRQQDVSTHCGISMSRYRAIEHGSAEPNDLDRRLIEKFLPPLPPLPTTDAQLREQRTSAESSP